MQRIYIAVGDRLLTMQFLLSHVVCRRDKFISGFMFYKMSRDNDTELLSDARVFSLLSTPEFCSHTTEA